MLYPMESTAQEAQEPEDNAATVTRSERRRNRRLLFVVLGVITAMVVGGIALVGWYAKSAVDALDNISRDPGLMPTSSSRPSPVSPQPGVAQPPLNIVLMGSDTRGKERGRSDVLQLLHISGDRSQAFLMSIPRDTWVDIPGRRTAKINAAYSWGGAALTVETVEQLLEVPIDHTVITDFTGFTKLIDALGGVTVYNQEASSVGDLTFPAGEVTLDGESALVFVRQRYGLSDGDFGRATRQREVIKASLSKLASAGVLADPLRFRESITTLGSNLTVDEGLTNEAIFDLGWSMRGLNPSSIASFQFPTAGFSRSSDGQSIVLVNDRLLGDLQTALRNDTLAEYVKANG